MTRIVGCTTVPEEVSLAAKRAIVPRMLERVSGTKVPAAWITDDERCGDDPGLRRSLEAES